MIEVRRRYKYVVEDWDRHGNPRNYLRLPGQPKIRLHTTPGTPEFDAEYREAIAAGPTAALGRRTPTVPGSLDALCTAYYGSAEFKLLHKRTQHVRRLILGKLCKDHGHKPVALIEAHHLRVMRDARAETPEAANSIIKAMRAVFKVGIGLNLCNRNPADHVPYLRQHTDGFHTWTLDEVEQFESHHPVGTSARLALALLLYTAQRRSDVVLFGRQHVRDGWLTFTQVKNKTRRPVTLSIPVIPDLRDVIESSPCGDLTFLVTEFRRPFSAAGFGNRFRAWCDAAGLPHCSAHGLRKASATRLAERGCTAHEIAAITGHTSIKQVQHYTVAVSQRSLAASAMTRLTGEQIEPEKSHPKASIIRVGRKSRLTG